MKTLESLLLIAAVVVLVVIINLGFSGRLTQEAVVVNESPVSAVQGAEVVSETEVVAPKTNKVVSEVSAPGVSRENGESKYIAQKSIRKYLNTPDPRSPTLATYVPRVQATAEERSDPEAYKAYEARQNESHARLYASAAMSQMGAYETRIRQAQLEGGYDQREIDKALERLEKLKEMQVEIREKHPHWQ